MLKRTFAVIMFLAAAIFMMTGVEAAKPLQSPDDAIEILTDNPMFSSKELEFMTRSVDNIGNGNGRDNDFHGIETTRQTPQKSDTYSDGDNWLIYWYVCGSNIESERIKWDRTASDFERGKIVVADKYYPGDITLCIREVERANLSSGKVKILMQAGGTYLWGHKKFQTLNAGVKLGDEGKFDQVFYNVKVGRYLYDKKNKNWKAHDTFSITANPNSQKNRTDMGSKEGLIDFLSHGKEMEKTLYPDGKVRRVFIFVDHGGGSLTGVCSDQYTMNESNPDGHMLGIKDIHDAFDAVWGSSETNPPFELVAFDTRLMSTYETAMALRETAHYMVASEEETYGKVMFDYTGFLSELSTKPTMNGGELGRVICDTYRNDCLKTDKKYDVNFELVSTMSVVDLSKMPALESAYKNFGKEMLNYLKENPGEIGAIGGAAIDAENYPCPKSAEDVEKGKKPTMVDLKDYAVQIKATRRFKSTRLKETSDELIKAIDGENYNGAVIYNQVRGISRNKGGGLSTYYPFTNIIQDISAYAKLADYNFAPISQSEFYSALLKLNAGNPENLPSSKLPSDTNASTGTNNSSDTNAVNPSLPQGSSFDLSDLEKVEVKADDKTAKITLTQEQMGRVASVRCNLTKFSYQSKGEDDIEFTWQLLGNDTAIKANWDTGEFESTFIGKWIMIENQPAFVYVVSECGVDENGNKNGSELYSVPVKLNGRLCTMLISCKYPEEKFSLVAARPETNSNVPTGEFYGVKKGDLVDLQYFSIKLSMKALYELIKPFIEKYPEFETIFLETTSNDERTTAIENFFESLPEESRALLNNIALSGKVLRVDLESGESPFIVKDTIKIEPAALPDGVYLYGFEFLNPVGGDDAETKQKAIFAVKGGKVLGALDGDYTEKFINILITSYYQAIKKINSGVELEN